MNVKDNPIIKKISKNKKIKKIKKIKSSRIIKIIVSMIIIMGLILVGTAFQYFRKSLEPLQTNSHQVVQIQIPANESDLDIGMLLQNNSLIRSGHVFYYDVKLHHYNLKSGYYRVSPHMSDKAIIKELKSGGAVKPFKANKYIKKQIRVKKHSKRKHHSYYINKTVNHKIIVNSPKLV